MLRSFCLFLCATCLAAQSPRKTEVLVSQILTIKPAEAKETATDVLGMDLEWIDARGPEDSGRIPLERHYLRYQFQYLGQVQDPPCEGRRLIGSLTSSGEATLHWEAHPDIFPGFAYAPGQMAQSIGFPWPYPADVDPSKALDPLPLPLLAQLVQAEGSVSIFKSDLKIATGPLAGSDGLLVSGPIEIAVNSPDGPSKIEQRFSGTLRMEGARNPLRVTRIESSGVLKEAISSPRRQRGQGPTTTEYRYESRITLDWDSARIAAARMRALDHRIRRFNLLRVPRFRIVLQASSCWSIEPSRRHSTIKHTGAGKEPAFTITFGALGPLSPEEFAAEIAQAEKSEGFAKKLEQEHKLGRQIRILIAAEDGLRCLDFLDSPEGVLRVESLSPKADSPHPRHEEFLRGLFYLPPPPSR